MGTPADYESELYGAGATGEVSAFPFDYEELERRARAGLDPRSFNYVAGAAGRESTLRANRAAFQTWEIVPRQLRGSGRRDLGCEVLGTGLAAPLLLAPVGALGTLRPDAERMAAQVAAELGLASVLSCLSCCRLEELALDLGTWRNQASLLPAWFQLYWPKDRELALSLVQRAEAAGYSALVLTVDTWTLAWRPRDLVRGYLPFLSGQGLANYLSDPLFRAGLPEPPEQDLRAAVLRWQEIFGNPDLSWEDVSWLKARTRMPLAVKGICHPDDARAAWDAGADAVVVSNHGGRQVDGARASLDCLPEVVAASPGREVLFDSGVRCGADILKALALGARAVLLGRPFVYALAAHGEPGLRHTLRCLLAELDLTLALSGHRSCSELGPDTLAPRRR
ncbi:MAG: alpha-hydroxy-acid oxidizing protein [Candidatus Dormibacteria bacterium]